MPTGKTHAHWRNSCDLAKLVGAVAPTLDVASEVLSKSGTETVAQPGDWLKISDLDLVHRLQPDPDPDGTGSPKAERELLQPIKGDDGQIFGRAFISAS